MFYSITSWLIFQMRINEELDATVEEIKELRMNSIDIISINENLFVLDDKTKELSSSMEKATTLSDKINAQIHELDVARVSVRSLFSRIRVFL